MCVLGGKGVGAEISSGNTRDITSCFHRIEIKCALFRVSLLKQCAGCAILASGEVHGSRCASLGFMPIVVSRRVVQLADRMDLANRALVIFSVMRR